MNQEPRDSFELLLKRRLSSETPSGGIADACPDENWMAAYLERTQSERQKAEFEKHLLKCMRCQEELALLIKTGAMTEDSKAPAGPTGSQTETQNKGRPWSWFGWLAPVAFRPVFAILVISVVSAILGYRLIREPGVNAPTEQLARPLSQESSPSLAQNNSDNSRPSPFKSEGGEISGQRETAKESSIEFRPPAKSGPTSLPATAAPEPSPVGGEVRRNRTDALADTYTTEAPPSVPSESEHKETLSEARPLSPPPPSTESVSVPVSGGLKKTTSKDELSRQSLPTQPMVGAAERVQELETAQDKPRLTMVPSPPATVALGKNDSSEKKERDAEPGAKFSAIALMKRKQERSEVTGQAVGSAASSLQRIEAGRKSFELRENVWTDTSIREQELASATLILIPSPEFDRLRQALLPFQPILSHPQDTLIKQNNRVYRIRKAHR